MSIPTDQALEYRVARIAFNQGYLCRRRISWSSLLYPDRFDVTDIDVLGIRFDSSFMRTTGVWECTTAQEDRPIERTLWLLGMAQYLGASYKCIVRPTISDKVKAFAGSSGVVAWDDNVLAALEKSFSSSLSGSNDATRYFKRSVDDYLSLKNSKNMTKAYWFLKSGFWFETADGRLKKSLTALEYCINGLAESKPEVSRAARDLLFEGLVLTSVAILDMAGRLYPWQQAALKERTTLELTSGLGSQEERSGLIEAAVTFAEEVKGVKTSRFAGLPIQIPPPSYANDLVDVLERFYERPVVAVSVPRYLETIIYDSVIPETNLDKRVLAEYFHLDIELLNKMARNVLIFLERSVHLPKDITNRLTQS